MLLVDSYGEATSTQVEGKLEILKNYVIQKGFSPKQAQERIEKIPQNIHLVSENWIIALLEEAGFKMVERFYSALLVGGWVAERR